MTENSQQTIYLKDYTQPFFWVEEVQLHFDLTEEQAVVTSLLRLRRNTEGELRLNGQELELSWVKLNGETLSADQYRLDDESLTLSSLPDEFELEIQTTTRPQDNTSLSGLYKSSGNFCTQCEAEGFRKITYYPDRPDVMALFTTTIVADKVKYPVLLSNGNLIAQSELEDGRHQVTWQDPFKKPCYLFALVAGQLECIEDRFTTMSGREVTLQIFVEAHNVDKCDHAMRSLKRSMQWDEQVYGCEYDLDIYMIVAVDDFNMGAMENKGLNVFNSKYVLASPETATDDDFNGIESVIAHEYFHNWSGNRITCRDWFQLSLKEGFTVFRDQEFSADMFSRAVKRIEDVNRLRSHQFAEDDGPMAHPVRPESYVEINNFYTLTVYEKGAEVVRMVRTLLGEENFRNGSDLYFQRHDGQAVTTDDFIAAMEEASGVDLRQFKRWYQQAGTPVLECTSQFDELHQTFTLSFHQSCPATPGQKEKAPFHIPVEVGLLAEDGTEVPMQLKDGELLQTNVLEIKSTNERFRFVNVAQKPVPSLLRHFSAPVKLKYDYSAAELAFLMAHDSDAFNRWDAGQQLALQLLQGLIEQHRQAGSFDLSSLDVLYGHYSSAFGKLLAEQELDPNLLAAAMTLPSEHYISETLAVVDPVAVHEARWFLRATLAAENSVRLSELYQQNCSDALYVVDAESIGRRALKNSALGYLATAESSEIVTRCYQQYQAASNMTDAISALHCLNHIDCSERQQALEQFYSRWKDEALVVDKWLALQAVSRLPGTLTQVQSLMNHEAFNIKNPNKVRSLIGAFVNANAYRFHAADGAGYQFLAEQVITLDKMNPHVAARLVNPLIHWRRYDADRQQIMKQQLNRVAGVEGLSKDVREIVSKGLAE